MSPKKTARRNAPKRPKDPRFILDGPNLFIHIDDLIKGLVGFGVRLPISSAVDGLTIWKDTCMDARGKK